MPTLAKKCLLIKLPDGGRQLFTHHKNYPNLVEFSKKFNAQLEIVKAASAPLLELEDLAKHICDQNYSANNVKYETVPVKQKKTYFTQYTSFSGLGSREKMLKKVSDIRDAIYDMFVSGQLVRIKELESKFQKHQLSTSTSTIYRHVNYVKDKLEAEGRVVTKVSPGVYKIKNNS